MNLVYFFIGGLIAQVSYLTSENSPKHTIKGTGCFELDEDKINSFDSDDKVIGKLFSEPGCKGSILATGKNSYSFYASVNAKSIRISDDEDSDKISYEDSGYSSQNNIWANNDYLYAAPSYYYYYPSWQPGECSECPPWYPIYVS